MKKRIIAISAKKRCGKDTAADYISAKYGYTKYALATPFKKMLCKHFHFSEDMINGIGYDREQTLDITFSLIKEKFEDILKDLGYSDTVIETINWDVLKDVKKWSVRRLMQAIGTDIGCDQVDKYIWMHPVVKLDNENVPLLISDCRQDHEMEVLRTLDALVIHIINPLDTNRDDHITERGLPAADHDPIIINAFDASQADDPNYCKEKLRILYEAIDQILQTYINK